MDLIPITRIKISKEEWLKKPIQYEDNLYIQDILEDISEKTYQWILEKEDLNVLKDYDSFKVEFINLIYTKYCHE
jgi:trans-2-enoyl-CoA reductase